MMNGSPPEVFTASAMPDSSSIRPPMPRLPAVIAMRFPGLIFSRNPNSRSLPLTSAATFAIRSGGRFWRTCAIAGNGLVGKGITGLDDLTDLVLHDRLDDFPAFFLASDQRFSKLHRLLGIDLPRQRRFVRIDNGLNDGRPAMGQ